jgi:cell wall-associated NlpC family hydrolase
MKILYDRIGGYDEKYDCLYPVYLLYPEIPLYERIQDENYFSPLIDRHFSLVKEPQKGDMLVFKFFNGYHFGVYAGGKQFFHCCEKFGLRISRLSGYRKFLKGIYRWSNP